MPRHKLAVTYALCYINTMQKVATQVFITASVAFGIIGIALVLTAPAADELNSDLNIALMKLLFITVFIILPSFALSIAAKYLNGKDKR